VSKEQKNKKSKVRTRKDSNERMRIASAKMEKKKKKAKTELIKVKVVCERTNGLKQLLRFALRDNVLSEKLQNINPGLLRRFRGGGGASGRR
jgi:hypothetical protein